jgi:predicted acetyltransferase
MMKLVIPAIQYEAKFNEMIEDYRQNGENTFDSDYFTKNFDFIQYIQDIQQLSDGVGLPEGYVPTTEWWMINDNGDIVGTVRLRHYLSDRNMQEGGHIGYDISPRFRGQGIGTVILRMALGKAMEFGLKDVLLTCDFDNAASRRIIETNGGKFENEIISEDSQKPVYRYWIRL